MIHLVNRNKVAQDIVALKSSWISPNPHYKWINQVKS